MHKSHCTRSKRYDEEAKSAIPSGQRIRKENYTVPNLHRVRHEHLDPTGQQPASKQVSNRTIYRMARWMRTRKSKVLAPRAMIGIAPVIDDGSISSCVSDSTSAGISNGKALGTETTRFPVPTYYVYPGKADRYDKPLLTDAHLSLPVQPSQDESNQLSTNQQIAAAPLMTARVTPSHYHSASPSLDCPASTRMVGYLTENHASSGRQVAAKHPHYEDFNTRLTSFVHWSSGYTQSPTSLASAGLFYTGTSDLVRCFLCGIGLRHWEQGDDPLEEHVRHYPDCEFLNAKYGTNTITKMKESLGIQPQNPSTRHESGSMAPNQSESVVENARSPQYASYQVRVSTYSKWPRHVRQTPAELAEAGLYFTGVEDIVRCYACDGGLRRWNPEDDPWIEHAKWFPNCSHLKKVKGQAFIDRVRALVEENVQHPENPSAQDLNQLSEEMNKLNVAAGAKEDQGSSKEEDPLSTAAAQSVQAMGYSKKAILMAISELNKETGKPISSVQILELLMDKEERGENLPEDEPEISEEELKNVLASDTASSNLVEENQKLISVIKCADCKKEDRNCLFLPCTHHRFCEDCAARYTSCPICGRPIKQKLKTYMS